MTTYPGPFARAPAASRGLWEVRDFLDTRYSQSISLDDSELHSARAYISAGCPHPPSTLLAKYLDPRFEPSRIFRTVVGLQTDAVASPLSPYYLAGVFKYEKATVIFKPPGFSLELLRLENFGKTMQQPSGRNRKNLPDRFKSLGYVISSK